MTDPGAGSWGLCIGSSLGIALPPRLPAGPVVRMLLRRAAHRPAGGPAWGPAFVYRPRYWARAARPLPRPWPLPRAPSELGEVGACCQVTPPPQAPGARCCGGTDAQTAPSCPGPAAHGAPRPPYIEGPRSLAAVGGLMESSSPPFQQHRLASSPSRPRLILSLLLPACCQVLKDARAPADAGQLVPVSVVPTRPRGAAVGHS